MEKKSRRCESDEDDLTTTNAKLDDTNSFAPKELAEDSKIDFLLWNVEGLKSILELAPNELLAKQDVLVLTETFMTDNIDIPGFYATHVSATQGLRGRPIWGISCYY
ncbi:hypothetical protein ANN_26177 [Periplaneta americana]|uniref:Uncharacterized protein n=1 Tax=Periplaneta americana TaxID=6978 RepID=A0ABQ8S572_PERAM|nr:hypothetical protein ANN_26177 [Periplaneta americana]